MKNWPEFIKDHFATVAFFQFMGASVVSASHGKATVKLPIKPQYSNSYGISHGGITAALVDMAAGVALRTLKLRVVTVDTSTNYFAPVKLTDELIAEAQLVHGGRTILHAEVKVFNQEKQLVAEGKATYCVLGDDSEEFYK